MILIAESGSTKTQWCIINVEKTEEIVSTSGLNPIILSNNEIESVMRPVAASIDLSKLSSIYFFGAGCSMPKNLEKIETALSKTFQCKNIKVDTDLKAACLALAGDQPGLIGLLGTGSNSCYWNGKEIAQKTPSLGFILGDEGGGVSIGKQLITDYLKQQMPEHLRQDFLKKYDLTYEYVLERVYQSPMPNRFLAGFAPFAEAHIEEAYCQSIVYNQFEMFLKKNILNYSNIEKVDLYFCGSIAFFHQDILEEICSKYGLKIKKLVKEPINELSNYFRRKLN